MTTCLTHLKKPDLKNCPKCRKECQEVFDLWLKQKEIREIG